MSQESQEIAYRPAKPSDLDLTYNIKVKSLKPYVEQIWGWDEDVQKKLHIERFDYHKTSIIVKGNIDIGLYELREQDETVFIDNILIIEGFQSQGIGSLILHKIITLAKQKGFNIRLQVFKINRRAKKFYERWDFIQIDEAKFHYVMEMREK